MEYGIRPMIELELDDDERKEPLHYELKYKLHMRFRGDRPAYSVFRTGLHSKGWDYTEQEIIKKSRKFYRSLLRFEPTLVLDKIELYKASDFDLTKRNTEYVPYKVINELETGPFISAVSLD